MKAIGVKYVDVNHALKQIEEDMKRGFKEKSMNLLSCEYKESIEKVEYLYKEAEEVKVYLKTLEDLIEIEVCRQGEVYDRMYKLAMQ